MARKSVSIYDIAQLAGVSTATVSKVLNGKGSISQATRDRVLEIARTQGYVASYAARTLREGSTRTVGVLVPDVSNPFFSSIVQRVETLLYDADYTCYICDTYNDSERTERYLRGLAQRQVDGLVFVSGHFDIDALNPPEALPMLMLDAVAAKRCTWTVSVVNDLSAIVRDNVRMLARHGCQHIAVLAVFSGADNLSDDWMGLKATLAEFGLKLDRNLLLKGPHLKESRLEAEQLVGECLDDGFVMDGIVCLGDRVALGACAALRKRELAIGKDVLVVGMDNSLYSRVAGPTISSVDRHIDEMAEEGVQALLSMMAGQKPAEHLITIGYDIVERESTLGVDGVSC